MSSRSLKALCSYLPFSQALTKALHTNQIAVGGPVWQEALVQHCLEEQSGSHGYLPCSGPNQSIVGDPVWQGALVQHCLEEL